MEHAGKAGRILALEGGCNFRDLGGYAAESGRRVKWRSLYRSGAMDRLSDPDFARLGEIGLRAICDFRSSEERTRAPTAWDRLAGVRYWSRDYEHSIGDLNRLLAGDAVTLQEARAVMSGIYRRLPAEQEAAYRELFAMLAQGEVPLVFNCSAGKDRTGLAAALVLTALGVPYALVVEDYELSSRAFDYRAEAARNGIGLPGEVIDALGGTHPDYLAAAWSAIIEHHGDPMNYIRDRLGVSPASIEAIRANLLE